MMPQTISVELVQIGPSTSRLTARSHSLVVDRPVEKGGRDQGPLGGELLLASLGGCFVSTLLAAVKTRGADVGGIRVEITGIVGGVPERFESIHMSVSASYANEDDMRKLLAIAERGCLVTNTLRDAVSISVKLEVPS
jgi:putative redox protein